MLGFIAPRDALWEVEPVAIPQKAEAILREANPEAFLKGARILLDMAQSRENYYMYERKIANFISAASLRTIARTFSE
jgi:hypothetical protein